MTTPGQDKYNMPLYDIQVTNPISPDINVLQSPINYFPVYQGFLGPAYINGIPVGFQTQQNYFYNKYNYASQSPLVFAIGNGTAGPYNFKIPIIGEQIPPNPPFNCLLRGHVDITGIITTNVNQDPPLVTNVEIQSNEPFIQTIPVTSVDSAVFITSIDSTGSNVEVRDSGQFLDTNVNEGLLMQPGKAPNGNLPLLNGYSTSFMITDVTQATQAVVSVVNTLVPNVFVQISGIVGMTQLFGTYTVVSANPTSITLNVDSTSFSPYISGGFVSVSMNVINYFSGQVHNLFFPAAIPSGANIFVTCSFFESGLPREILFYNNVLTLRCPPAFQYHVELDAYLSPAAFLTSSAAIPFGYMSEYIARGAARKILSDTGDAEQLQFYEPFFREQEQLVWKRSQRQWTATRTETLYSRGNHHGHHGISSGSNY
jgi:hypothetical protein